MMLNRTINLHGHWGMVEERSRFEMQWMLSETVVKMSVYADQPGREMMLVNGWWKCLLVMILRMVVAEH